ncbi:MAG: amidohydrolase family protein, partial [Candidatus Cloacimonetes bacterium]|nr:amidohydrolase family protein [Candidatus Cloacimonadota bacterium]
MIFKTNILNPVSAEESCYFPDVFVSIEDGKIKEITSTCEDEFSDYSDCVCTPGFIDLHTHLAQYYVRGKHSFYLLDWLNRFIYPEEIKSFDPDFTRQLAK